MKIIYWNIKDKLTTQKEQWLEETIIHEAPSIICIAEGPVSIADCIKLESLFNANDYITYYSPTMYSTPVISNQFGWKRFGLKVFVRKDFKIKGKFTFFNQKLDGRIIYLRFESNNEFYSLYLIHGMSKAGDEINQHAFIVELSQFIRAKTLEPRKGNDKTIIMGDFNIEPWENLLKQQRYIYSFFFTKMFEYHSRMLGLKFYYNPILEYIQNHVDGNLIGTFYNKDYISSLDFPLLQHDITNYDFEILTSINKKTLMKSNISGNHSLVDNLDHLPISLKIK